jgi:hypothetical protein
MVSEPKQLTGLELAAAKLMRAAPREWDQFYSELARLYDQLSHNVVMADADKVLEAQGHARRVAHLLKTLTRQ